MAEQSSPYYVIVVFWGEQHRQYFMDYSLASLLSEHNIPALEKDERNRFLICTTREDWEAIQDRPVFQLLASYLTPEFLDLGPARPDEINARKMSRGHKMLTERAFADGAYFVYTTPDTIFADGYIAEVQRLARAGEKLVLFPTGRYDADGLTGELRDKGFLRDDAPMCLPPRDAVAAGFRNMHSCLIAANWESPCFWEYPVYCYWPVPGEDGVVYYTFNWFFVLIDFSAIDIHHSDALDNRAIDGDYYSRNFGHLADEIHIVDDSDRLMILPLTPKDYAEVPLEPHWSKSWPIIGNWTKGYFLNEIFNRDALDPLKRKIYFTPVRMHSGEIVPRKWRRVERKSLRILRRYISVKGGETSSSKYLNVLTKRIETARGLSRIYISITHWLVENRFAITHWLAENRFAITHWLALRASKITHWLALRAGRITGWLIRKNAGRRYFQEHRLKPVIIKKLQYAQNKKAKGKYFLEHVIGPVIIGKLRFVRSKFRSEKAKGKYILEHRLKPAIIKKLHFFRYLYLKKASTIYHSWIVRHTFRPLFVYLRTLVLASLGDDTERERIKRRIRKIRSPNSSVL